MYNWVSDKQTTIEKLKNAIMGELETLLTEEDRNMTANYWIDNCHNVFATISEDDIGNFLDIRLELYDYTEELVGDLYDYETADMSKESLEEAVMEIIADYYGERF